MKVIVDGYVATDLREESSYDPSIALLPPTKFTEWTDSIVASNTNMYKIRRWGDPLLGRSVTGIGVSNFQAVGLYNKANKTLGGVSNYLRMPKADMNRVMALQIEDEYLEKKDAWRLQKMNWLCDKAGSPYFYFHHAQSGDWVTLSYMEWGTIAFGGNIVYIESVEVLDVKLTDGIRRQRPMGKVRSFRTTDWGRPLVELLAEGLVQRCFCAYLPNDKFGDTPKGIVYSPFYSPLDWTFINTTQVQPKEFYIPMQWVTK